MKIIIASTHCSRTDLIEYQFKSIKKFVKNDYDYYVFNDATQEARLINFNNPNIRQEIRDTCSKLNINCIDIPQNIHKDRQILFPNTKEFNVENAVTRCADSTQYLYNYFKDTNQIIVIIDSDMFFIKHVDIVNDILNDNVIAYIGQAKGNDVAYMWNGFLVYNLEKMINCKNLNFDCGNINGEPVDVGGHTHFWLQENKHLNKKILGCFHIPTKTALQNYEFIYPTYIQEYFNNVAELNQNDIINKELIANDIILHMRGAGGNWDYANSSFKKYLSKKYNNKHIHYDILNKEWKNFQFEHGALVGKFLDNIITIL